MTAAGEWEAVGGEELCALALAADPATPLGPDAIPYDQVIAAPPALLSEWYMAGATAVAVGPWRRRVILAVVLAFLAIDAAGLCSTYGVVTWA